MAPRHTIEEVARTVRVVENLLTDYDHAMATSPAHAEPVLRAMGDLADELCGDRRFAWLVYWIDRARFDHTDARTGADVATAIREALEWAAGGD